MELSEFIGGTRTFTVTANAKGDRLTITYDPGAVSRRERQALDDLGYLLRVVKTWDLTRGGQPVPITQEALEDLPTRFITILAGYVMHDESEIPKERWALLQTGSAPGQ